MFFFLIILFFLFLPFAYDSSCRVRYYARFYLYYGYVMIAAVFLIPIMAFRPRDVNNLILASKVCKVISRILGLKWTLRGEEVLSDPTPCVMVANHQSSLDILGMFEIWAIMGRVTVVAKRELLFAGPFGLAAWLCDLIFIDRTDPTKARTTINNAVQLRWPQKAKLWIFPEGTRRNTGIIHPFKKGAFHIAISSQLPITPVVFSHYYFLDAQQKTFGPGEVTISVLPPISTDGLTESDTEELMDKIRNLMVDTFEESKINNKLKS